MSDDWKTGDIAVALADSVCGCGQHSVTARTYYRVYGVVRGPIIDFGPVYVRGNEVYLDVLGGDAHVFHHSNFRKERPADKDIFKLCEDTPLRVTEDA